ncbi:MAG: hypothetical protein GX446_16450 [Chthonomonadales bacterium]|nr:hypothetical protein [Chthonomonadales bacterium]
MRVVCCLAALAALTLFGRVAGAEQGVSDIGPVLNLDAPGCPDPGKTVWSGGVRIFGSKQDAKFGDLRLDYGVREGLALTLRGTAGERRTFVAPSFAIHHGGNDAELLLRYMPPQTPRCALEIGVSYADTPAQKDTFPTVQLLHQRPLSSTITLLLAPRAVFIEDNTLVGIGGGLAWKINDTGELVADVTGIVHGDNTYNTHTGERVRRAVWGVALRMRPENGDRQTTIDLGITNALGGTTGMSLTPGLGGSLAGFVAFGCRY